MSAQGHAANLHAQRPIALAERKVVPCTTAAAVRIHVVEPALELAAIEMQKRKHLIALAALTTRSDALAREIAGFADACADKLDLGERSGCFQSIPGIATEKTNMQDLAGEVRESQNVLRDSSKRRHHAAARDALGIVFDTYGDDLFENTAFRHELGAKRLLSLRGTWNEWKGTR